LAVSWKAVDEFEAQGDEQGETQEHEGQDARVVHHLQVADEMGDDVQGSQRNRTSEYERAAPGRLSRTRQA
jgi:hypothetical protein